MATFFPGKRRDTGRARRKVDFLARVSVRHRGVFSYIDGVLPEGTTLKAVPAALCRLSP